MIAAPPQAQTPVLSPLMLYRDGLDWADWYDVAHADIIIASRHFKVRPEYMAGLLATFSPRTSVRRSIRHTFHYLRTGTFNDDVPGTIRVGVRYFVDTGRIRGPKTQPFFLALLGDPNAVVVDSHMLRAFGHPIKPNQAAWDSTIDAIRAIARNRTTPARAQAALWCGYLLSRGRNPTHMPILDTLME